jgi:glycosyltransferase 2 family protein
VLDRIGATWLSWLTGAVLLVALVLVVTHFAEERRLAALLQRAQPIWLLAAAALQVGTYGCAAGVWYRALDHCERRPAFGGLVPLGLAKLFTDQAVPSAGLSGTLLVVRGLTRRGVPRGEALAAMLVGLVAFYFAYALAVAAALTGLWSLGEIDRSLLALATLLGALAGIVPAALLWLRDTLLRRLPPGLRRIPGVQPAVSLLSELPRGRLWRPRVAAETIALQLAVFLLDAATLWAMLAAVGAPTSFPVVFLGFVSASVVATLAWVPGGIGTFEGTCVLMLRSHGVPLEAALAGTLLLRGFTFWLPMAPGLWLARRELRAEVTRADP